MTNRNPVLKIFITWPQTATPKQEFLDFLLSHVDLQYALIVQETHEDGNKHLHACVLTKKKYSQTYYVKKLKIKYPHDYKRVHVRPCRSFPHASEYCHKEDPNPLKYGTPPADQDPIENRYRRFLRSLGDDIFIIRGIYDAFLENDPSWKYLYLFEEYLKI